MDNFFASWSLAFTFTLHFPFTGRLCPLQVRRVQVVGLMGGDPIASCPSSPTIVHAESHGKFTRWPLITINEMKIWLFFLSTVLTCLIALRFTQTNWCKMVNSITFSETLFLAGQSLLWCLTKQPRHPLYLCLCFSFASYYFACLLFSNIAKTFCKLLLMRRFLHRRRQASTLSITSLFPCSKKCCFSLSTSCSNFFAFKFWKRRRCCSRNWFPDT